MHFMSKKTLCVGCIALVALAFLYMKLTSSPKAAEEVKPTTANDASMSDVKYNFEVKFVLDADKVLADGTKLKDAYAKLFNIKPKANVVELLYLDTPGKDFNKQFWVNRIRIKGKKGVELTYKYRIPVANGDIKAAIAQAQKTDVDFNAHNCKAQIDWGNNKMNFSPAYSVSIADANITNLKELTTQNAHKLLKEHMPLCEQNTLEKGWGLATMDKAKLAGPVLDYSYSGTYEGQKISIGLMPVTNQKTHKTSYTAELSFKVNTYDEAKTLKEKFTASLDKAGILKHEDSLKTQLVLNAYM